MAKKKRKASNGKADTRARARRGDAATDTSKAAPADASKPASSAEKPDKVKLGQRVKVIGGEYMSTRGAVEALGAAGVTVRVHARLAVTVPADQIQAV